MIGDIRKNIQINESYSQKRKIIVVKYYQHNVYLKE